MVELTLTERTEPFTLEEVFDFIDDTNISKRDAHELKSRIADVVHDSRNKAIEDVLAKIKIYGNVCAKYSDYMSKDLVARCVSNQVKGQIVEIIEQMKEV